MRKSSNLLPAEERILALAEPSTVALELGLGVGRSGGIWGGWMAGNLGSLPFGVIDDKYEPNSVTFPGGTEVLRALHATYPEAKKVLLIEGASVRGETINKIRTELSEQLEIWEVKFAVLFVSRHSNAKIDFIGRLVPDKFLDRMPWHHTSNWKTFINFF